MIRKSFDLTVKAVDVAAGSFTGAASVYNVIDLHGDVIVPGAFDATLKQKGDTRPLLWQHQMDNPIGVAAFADGEGALLTEGSLTKGVRQADEAALLIDAKAVRGLSIGFDIVKERWDGPIRIIEEIDLWEVSPVTFPANPHAQIDLKNMEQAERVLKGLQAREAKAGRVLSAANLTLVENAIEALTKLRDAAAGAEDEDGKQKGSGAPASDSTATISPDDASRLLDMFGEIRSIAQGSN